MPTGFPQLGDVATVVSTLVAVISACCAVVCWRKSLRAARGVRSVISTLEELHEIRDYMAKLDQWSKRINSRLAMSERHASGEFAPRAAAAMTKDDLRRAAGIVPGRPVPHRE